MPHSCHVLSVAFRCECSSMCPQCGRCRIIRDELGSSQTGKRVHSETHPRYMHLNNLLWSITLCLLSASRLLSAQQPAHTLVLSQFDSDGDGLSDALEQALLTQFAPSFMVGGQDCSNVPAEFWSDVGTPVLRAEDGTIYGQVFPAKTSTKAQPMVEIHFYHLWQRDCGDGEHVSALVQASESDLVSARWKAMYWYAAAHENTVCDVSQIARASTLHADDHGAKVWISPDKHASYLNETLCERGCGADRCQEMIALRRGKLINLGESGHPMNGSLFVSSNLWSLAGKMEVTNFPANPVARLNQMPDTDIAWFNEGRHPAQGIIAISSSTEGAIAKSGSSTNAAISVAGDSTGDAISVAGDSTGNALQKSYRKTVHALGTSARHVGNAVHLTPKPEKPE